MTAPFWIVANAEHGPSHWPHRHATQGAAIQEANRLVRQHGGAFYVLEAQIIVQKVDIVTRRLADDQEIPF